MPLIFLILVVAWHEVHVMADAKTDEEAINAVAISANTFASSFFKTVANSEAGNFVCSPFSVWMVLSMAAYGARGNTMNQMRSILALPENDTLAHQGFRITVGSLKKFRMNSKCTIQLANTVFLASNIVFKQKFKAVTMNPFYSKVQTVDFNNSVEASKTINEWCQAQTAHHIKDVIKADDLDSKTAALLVNAVYFKGKWADKFDVADTSVLKFNINGNTSEDVPTMFKYGDFNYGELPNVNATFIELPYERVRRMDSARMFIILPDQIEGLAELEKNIDKVTLKQLDAGEKCKVVVYLPKFKIKSKLSLKESLQSMGLVDMFDEKIADFTGIVDDRPLAMRDVVQKATIEVNEEGSTAAAVTSGVVQGKSMKFGSCNVDFNVNRPAVFIIATKDVILFSGSLKNPSQN